MFSDILNLEGHLNRCIGSEITPIFLNGWILPTGGGASGRVCPAACAAGLFSIPSQVLCHPGTSQISKNFLNKAIFNLLS